MRKSKFLFLFAGLLALFSSVSAQDKPYAGLEIDLVTFTGPQVAEPLQRHAPEFEALMRGEVPADQMARAVEARRALRGAPVDEGRVGGEKRKDSGLDLGGTVPAPA